MRGFVASMCSTRRGRRLAELTLALVVIAGAHWTVARPAVAGTAASADTYRGVPVGFTADGHPYRGHGDAPVIVVEYADYLCPFCQRHFSQTLPALLSKYVRTGQVKYVVRDFPIVALHPTAHRGAAASRCLGEQGAARFWQMYEGLFEQQQAWSRLPDPTAFLAALAEKSGADMTAYAACVASNRQAGAVQQSVSEAKSLGFNGTPTFQLVQRSSGKTYTLAGAQPVETFTRWIDALLAGQEPPRQEQAEAAPPKLEVPLWARPEGLAADPARPGFTVAGDRYRGDPSATVVVIEFSDFECPACQGHALGAQPELERRFVATGEVRWVVKHFPLGAHPRAAVAAAGAQCAGNQDRFWAMHHALFERMTQWATSPDVDAALTGIAGSLGLDEARFAGCLASRRPLERVFRDVYDGQAVGVRNVPAFVLFQGETPFLLVGARTPEQFGSLLRRQVDRARASAPAGATTGAVAR